MKSRLPILLLIMLLSSVVSFPGGDNVLATAWGREILVASDTNSGEEDYQEFLEAEEPEDFGNPSWQVDREEDVYYEPITEPAGVDHIQYGYPEEEE